MNKKNNALNTHSKSITENPIVGSKITFDNSVC